jgi:hypothetical protein
VRAQGRGVSTASSAVVLLLAILVSACASGGVSEPDSGGGGPTLRAPSEPPADPVEAARNAVEQAYRGMWAAYDQAGRLPEANPSDSRLAIYAAGNAHQRLSAGLGAMQEEGLVIEGEVVLSPEITELSPADSPMEARVEDCADSSDWRRVRADGEPFDDEPGGLRRIVADLEVTSDGSWKVTDFAVLEVGSC